MYYTVILIILRISYDFDRQIIKKYCHALRGNGYEDHQIQVVVVEIPCYPASKEPGYSKAGFKNAESCGSHGFRNNSRYCSFHNTFLSTHSYAPEDDSCNHKRPATAGENQQREEC